MKKIQLFQKYRKSNFCHMKQKKMKNIYLNAAFSMGTTWGVFKVLSHILFKMAY